MARAKYKAIFFDMGDTLLHFHEGPTDEEKDRLGLEKMASYLSGRYTRDVTFEALRDGFFVPWAKRCEQRKVTLEEYPVEDFLNAFLEPYGVRISLEEALQLMRIFHQEYGKYVTWEADLPQTLKILREAGFKLGVLSSCYLFDEVMIDHFKTAGIHEYMDSYTFSYYLRIRKPRPEIFLEALRRAGVKADESVMIGNLLREDIWGLSRWEWTLSGSIGWAKKTPRTWSRKRRFGRSPNCLLF